MNKQQEIRERIEYLLDNALYKKYVTGKFDETVADQILKYLHSQGVVIRGESLGFSHPHLASYFTVEPLIVRRKKEAK